MSGGAVLGEGRLGVAVERQCQLPQGGGEGVDVDRERGTQVGGGPRERRREGLPVAASEAVWEANSSEKMDDGSVGDDGGSMPRF